MQASENLPICVASVIEIKLLNGPLACTPPHHRSAKAAACCSQVQDGDVISIDAAQKQMNVEISDEELRCWSSLPLVPCP